MKQNQEKTYKVFLASPSDTKNEREIVAEIIKELNNSIGTRRNFQIRLLRWEDGVYPEFGEDGQDVINKQLGNEYDVFIGLMWKKFGTPTNRAGSGTEEEFNLAYECYKKNKKLKIMFYFNSKELPQDTDFEQFSKVKEFKNKIADLGGLYGSYQGEKEFEKSVRTDLTRCLLDLDLEGNTPKEENKQNQEEIKVLQIQQKFSDYLNDIGTVFAHKNVDTVLLEDLYVAPDLKNLKQGNGQAYSSINLEDLSDAIDVDGIKYIFVGKDTSGKTVSCKHLFKKYFDLGMTPLLIDGGELANKIRVDALRVLIINKLKDQYGTTKLESINRTDIVLVIDNFHKAAKGKNKYWAALIKNLSELSPNLILTGDSLMPIDNLEGDDPFTEFSVFSVLEFGPKLRTELIKKWYSLGIDVNFSDANNVRRLIDSATAHVKTIVGKGFMPVYPFYVLSILQALENGNTQSKNYSIHGFYYEHLINECFAKAVEDKNEISLYYNYLTHFCYHLFQLKTNDLNLEEFNRFHELYCLKFDLNNKPEKILRTLTNAKLLVVNNGVRVKEKYIYYFFVAKYLSNHISSKEIKLLVEKMTSRIFRDEYSSIIMFVTHLSKDEFIIQDLLNKANDLFPDTDICKLEEDVEKVNELIESLPEQVLELIDVEKNREILVENEEMESHQNSQIEKDFDTESNSSNEIDIDDDIDGIDFYARLILAMKTVEILGQIARKYWGELDGDKKLEIVTTTYNLGLRTLGYYLENLQNNQGQIIHHVKDLISSSPMRNQFILEKKVEETAKNFVFRLCFLSSFGITKRISDAIGYDKLDNTFKKALDANPINSYKLIDFSIKIGHKSIRSQIDLAQEYQGSMSKNKLSFMVLRNLVIEHLYMFDTDFRTRTKLCQILKISQKEQLKIDATSKVKKK